MAANERTEALRAEKLAEMSALLEELARRKRENAIRFYEPTPKQAEFHADPHRLRLLMAANQSGKTYSAGMEVAMHLTGEYPEWWTGYRFPHPTKWWISGVTRLTTRDTAQRILLGPGTEWGTGAIPKANIVGAPAMSHGINNGVESFVVRHKSGGLSYAFFKSYDMGREKFQGETLHGFWGDEELPYDIYLEALTRLNRHKGLFMLTFTPLMGMTEVVRLFYTPSENDEGRYERGLIQMDLNDATFYSDEDRTRIENQYPDWARRARARGLPMLGEGLVYPIDDEIIKCDPFVIPDTFRRIAGMDFGIDHPTAGVMLAHNPDTDTIYLYDCFKLKDATIADHCSAFRARGCDKIPVAWPHDLGNRDPRSGQPWASVYSGEGLNMLFFSARYDDKTGGNQAVEPVVGEILSRMRTGRFKVFKHLYEWFNEKNTYHRKDGIIVRDFDDLMAATRYAVMMLRYSLSHYEMGQWTPSNSRSLSYLGESELLVRT